MKGKIAKRREKPTIGTNKIQRVILKPSDLGTMPPRVAAFISSSVASHDFIFWEEGKFRVNFFLIRLYYLLDSNSSSSFVAPSFLEKYKRVRT